MMNRRSDANLVGKKRNPNIDEEITLLDIQIQAPMSKISPPLCLWCHQGFGPFLSKRSLPLCILLDDQRTHGIRTQPLPPRRRQLGRKLEPTSPLHRLERHLKVGNGLGVGDGRVGQDECPQGDITADFAVFGKNDLVKVCWDGDGGWVANHFVLCVPFPILRVALGEVQRPRNDAHAGVALGQTAAKVLEMRPVVPVEPLADLGAHVAEEKRLVHGGLAPFAVGGGDLVAAIVAAAKVVLEMGAELVGHGGVFDKDGVFAVAVALGEGGRGDVLDDPVGVAQAAVVGGDEGGAGGYVGDGAGEAIFEEARGVDGGDGGERSLLLRLLARGKQLGCWYRSG